MVGDEETAMIKIKKALKQNILESFLQGQHVEVLVQKRPMMWLILAMKLII